MATTTNYSWTTPDDTDLVKDGAAAIRTLGTSIDTTVFANAGAAINKTIIDAAGDLIYGTAADTAARLAIGTTNQVLTVTGGLPVWATPSGAITWTQRTALTDDVKTIAYNGTNLYVAAGSQGKLMTSPDGITWTARTSGFGTNQILHVAFGNGLFVAVGQNGTITTSTDGITWTARTSNMSTNSINSVIYDNSIWVAVGAGGGTTNTGGLTYSTDGITWTRKSQSITVGTQYFSVAYNGTNWVIAATVSSGNNYLYASTPAGTWTNGADGSATANRKVFYDGTRTLFINDLGVLRFSTSATIGTTTIITGITLTTTAAANDSFYYNGKIWNIGTYLIGISTTPLTGNYVNVTNSSVLSPTTQHLASGDSNNKASAIFVGAAGIIVGQDSPGLLFTSF